MNLAEELQLCAIGPDGRAQSSKLPAGFGGAVLADLSLAGRVHVGERVQVTDPMPVGDELLDRVLADLGDPSVAATTVPQGELEPDERPAALVVLANECDVLKLCVERYERRDAQHRAAAIGELDAISAGVRAAIEGARRAAAGAIVSAQG